MTLLMLYRYPWGDLTNPVASNPEEVISIQLDDNHCTGEDIFEIYGRTAKVRILRDMNIFDGWIIPGAGYNRPEAYDYSYTPPKRIFTEYLNYVFAIKRDIYMEDGSLSESENLFTGLVRIDSITDDEQGKEVEFTIYDLLWVWIDRAKKWVMNHPASRELNMGTDPSGGGFESLAQIMFRPCYPALGDFWQIEYAFNLDTAIYLQDQEYVLTGYEDDFDDWTYSRIFASGSVQYELMASWIRIDLNYGTPDNPTPDTNKLRFVMCKLYRTVRSGTIPIYYYAVRYLTADIDLTSIGMPINITMGSIDMEPLELDDANHRLGVLAWIRDCFLYPGMGHLDYLDNDFIMENCLEYIITEEPIQRIYWDGSKLYYTAMISFETMTLPAGDYMMSDVIKGMLAINNLTMYVNKDGVLRVINRLNFWIDTPPAVIVPDDDVIDYENRGTILDVSNVIDSIDIFEGSSSIKPGLLEFYQSYTDRFCCTVNFKLPPEYYRTLLDAATGTDLMLLPIEVKGNQFFLTLYSEVLKNELLKCQAIGAYTGISRAVLPMMKPIIDIIYDYGADRLHLSWTSPLGAYYYEFYQSYDVNAEFPSAWSLLNTSTDLFYDIATDKDIQYFRVIAYSLDLTRQSISDMACQSHIVIPYHFSALLTIPFSKSNDAIANYLYGVFDVGSGVLEYNSNPVIGAEFTGSLWDPAEGLYALSRGKAYELNGATIADIVVYVCGVFNNHPLIIEFGMGNTMFGIVGPNSIPLNDFGFTGDDYDMVVELSSMGVSVNYGPGYGWLGDFDNLDPFKAYMYIMVGINTFTVVCNPH
jgi:hypothetical protein